MRLLSFLLDGIFPPICCQCEKIGTLLCDKCYGQLEFDHTITATGILDSVQSCTQYGEVSSAIIQTLKYHSVKDVAVLCAQIMYMHTHIPLTDSITAVPLHKKRHNERGFNQAELIARELSTLLHVPYSSLVLRTKETINFAKVSNKDDRAKLSENLFDGNLTYLKDVNQMSVLLIDDVWTTGSTLNACATILKKAGAAKIHACTFSHGI